MTHTSPEPDPHSGPELGQPLALLPPGHDRDCALAMLNQARQRGGIDDIQVEHLVAIGYRAGRADASARASDSAADALIRASNDIVSVRAGHRVATPRPPLLTPKRISKWLRQLASTYRPRGSS